MTYNEKKSLYESIMKEVAKTVKRQINEMSVSNDRLNRIINKRKQLD
jgi:plasmid maintenance system antidote protein VapI